MTGIIVMVGVKTLVCKCLCALLTVGREFGGSEQCVYLGVYNQRQSHDRLEEKLLDQTIFFFFFTGHQIARIICDFFFFSSLKEQNWLTVLAPRRRRYREMLQKLQRSPQVFIHTHAFKYPLCSDSP